MADRRRETPFTWRGGPNHVHLRRCQVSARIIQPNGNYVTGHAVECWHDGATFFSSRLSTDCPAQVTCPECQETHAYRRAVERHVHDMGACDAKDS